MYRKIKFLLNKVAIFWILTPIWVGLNETLFHNDKAEGAGLIELGLIVKIEASTLGSVFQGAYSSHQGTSPYFPK